MTFKETREEIDRIIQAPPADRDWARHLIERVMNWLRYGPDD